MQNFPKSCTCCKRVHTAATWAALSYVGVIDDTVDHLELRNCSCDSTLAIVLSSTECEVTDAPMRARSTFPAAAVAS